METLNKLIQKIREGNWNYLEDRVVGGYNQPNFPGASGASRNPDSTNIIRYDLEVKYKKKTVVVTLEKKCCTPEHIRVHPGDVPTSTVFIDWENSYKGLRPEEKEAVEAEIERKVGERFMDKGARYVAKEERRITYNL